MKVFNITDASTAALRNQGLENQHIRVGETVIPPGGSAVIRGTAKERSELQVYVKVGAVTLDELPVTYAAKRGLSIHGHKLKEAEPVVDVDPAPGTRLALHFVEPKEVPPMEDPEPPKKSRK